MPSPHGVGGACARRLRDSGWLRAPAHTARRRLHRRRRPPPRHPARTARLRCPRVRVQRALEALGGPVGVAELESHHAGEVVRVRAVAALGGSLVEDPLALDQMTFVQKPPSFLKEAPRAFQMRRRSCLGIEAAITILLIQRDAATALHGKRQRPGRRSRGLRRKRQPRDTSPSMPCVTTTSGRHWKKTYFSRRRTGGTPLLAATATVAPASGSHAHAAARGKHRLLAEAVPPPGHLPRDRCALPAFDQFDPVRVREGSSLESTRPVRTRQHGGEVYAAGAPVLAGPGVRSPGTGVWSVLTGKAFQAPPRNRRGQGGR